ncbi:MAG: hypothetical protein MK116_11655 [Phycisphaerales bacterium]|nr:hypothetical protein [Phycisphaerales bacterium]
MTKLIARLIMATMLFPLGVIVFIGLIGLSSTISRSPNAGLLAVIWCVEYVFVGVYWILLWRPIVNWTQRRIQGTIVATFLSGIAGLLFGLFMWALTGQMEPAVGLGGMAPAVTFLLLTIWVWRETEEERLERLDRAEGTPIECTGCGYDMRGLRTTSCPECGVSPTLHQLFAGQSARDGHEIEQHDSPETP